MRRAPDSPGGMCGIPIRNYVKTLALAVASSFANVLAGVADGDAFGDWQAGCETQPGGEQVCHIYQRITLKDSGKTLLNVAVGYPPQQAQAVALFTLPLGVALVPGVEFRIERGEPARIPFAVCTTEGCRAALKLTGEMVQAMKKGNQATLTFATIEPKSFNVPISLQGFTKGINGLRQ